MPRGRLLITAGPTHEPIDAVRYIANRSSGRMGMCLAEAGNEAGWQVTLLLGPVAHTPPPAVRTFRYESTADLGRLLDAHFPHCDVLIMAAAVADYRPRSPAPGKLRRTDRPMIVELEPTPDLVAGLAASKRPDQRIVGFALEESAALERRATEKLREKGLDAIVANPLDTLGAGTIRATLLWADGTIETPPSPEQGLGKQAFARWLVERLG